jgi:hypothetical protein
MGMCRPLHLGEEKNIRKVRRKERKKDKKRKKTKNTVLWNQDYLFQIRLKKSSM